MATDLTSTEKAQEATASDPPPPVQIQRGYCRLHRIALPSQYPAQPRPDMALYRPQIVATRPGEELLCNGLHSGPHLWPDGDEAGEWEA